MKNNSRSGLRRRAGFTQLQLSRLTDVPAPRISLWERKQIDLRLDEIERIARVLHQSLRVAPVFNDPKELVEAFQMTDATSAIS